MFGLTLDSWNQVMVAALCIAAVVAIVVAGSQAIVIRLQRQEQAESNREFARYKEDAARSVADANARAAEANQKAAEAALALERIRRPRRLTPEQQAAVASAIEPFAKQQYNLGVGPGDEPIALLCQLNALLQTAGWIRTDPSADIVIPTPCGDASENSASGVRLFVPAKSEERITKPTLALLNALIGVGIATTAVRANDESLDKHPDAIQVTVGVKSLE